MEQNDTVSLGSHEIAHEHQGQQTPVKSEQEYDRNPGSVV